MTPLRIGYVAQLLGVSVDTVRKWVDDGSVRATRTPSGHREIDPAGLAEFLRESLNDASASKGAEITKTLPASSARNRFLGIVTNVTKDKVMASVEMIAGSFRIVSLMSSEACDDLGLEPGVVAVASVKATNMMIEVSKERI